MIQIFGCGAGYRLGSVELLQVQLALEQSFEPTGGAFANWCVRTVGDWIGAFLLFWCVQFIRVFSLSPEV